MTKTIRIENADLANFNVVVEVWDKGQNGEPDKKAFTRDLPSPTSLVTEYITSTRYMVVKEVPPSKND